jgi:hypothetical protein
MGLAFLHCSVNMKQYELSRRTVCIRNYGERAWVNTQKLIKLLEPRPDLSLALRASLRGMNKMCLWPSQAGLTFGTPVTFTCGAMPKAEKTPTFGRQSLKPPAA